MEVKGHKNGLISNILQTFCSTEESHADLKHEGGKIITEFSFLGKLSLSHQVNAVKYHQDLNVYQL